MDFAARTALSICALFAGMLLCAEIGRRLGLARLARDPDGLPKGAGAAEAAVFGLLGLMLAFTFSGAAGRLDDRRHLIADEANAIGTAYLRIDLLPAHAQPHMRTLFRDYVDVRIATFRDAEHADTTRQRVARGAALQAAIWRNANEAFRTPGTPAHVPMLVVPALNEMFDITTTRTMATRIHPPAVIFLLVGGLSLLGALLVGYGTSPSRSRTWLHVLTFAATLSLTVYVIVDLEYPRLGLIRVDAADRALIEVRQGMGPPAGPAR